MDITVQDFFKLQQETGLAENQQRLRAILAERRIQELEAKVAELLAKETGESHG